MVLLICNSEIKISLAFFRWVKLDIINANIKETRVPSTLKKSNLSAPKLYSHQSVPREKKENERFNINKKAADIFTNQNCRGNILKCFSKPIPTRQFSLNKTKQN